MKYHGIIRVLSVLAFAAVVPFGMDIHAAAQVDEKPQWDVTLYGQPFVLSPDILEYTENEGAPDWEIVREYIPIILPSAFDGKQSLSREAVLAHVKKMHGLYRQLAFDSIETLANSLIDDHPRLAIAGNSNPDSVAYFEVNILTESREYRAGHLDSVITDWFETNSWEKIIEDYNVDAEKPILPEIFIGVYDDYKSVIALSYLSELLEKSPPIQE